MTIDVIIPTYNPDGKLPEIIKRLSRQNFAPSRIILINSGKELDAALFSEDRTEKVSVEVINIPVSEFDHGRTRNTAGALSEADYLLFMTQDAVPADADMTKNLRAAFDIQEVAAAYARQLPDDEASLIERFSRSFNYPGDSQVKSAQDKERLGIKTYFCSNACAMYSRSVFEKLGRFPEDMIFNEDMVFAHTLISNGYRIAYAADARVYHSHNYTNMQQFRRNFDLAVSQAMHPEVFEDVSSESEGKAYVKAAFSYFREAKKPWYFIPFAVQSACRLAGYRLGKKYDKLPHFIVERCTASPSYFYRHWNQRK